MKCQHPNETSTDTCDRPAVIETGDLQAIHYLCAKHHEELQPWNDYRFDEVGS